MKNRRLIVILSIVAFLTVLVVINSTLFTLQSVSINWLTTKYMLESVKDYSIVDGIDRGQSIFLVNKSEIANSLEKKYPYLRVVSIETKFPNKIIIHSAERESLYAVKLSDNEFAILDEKGKVLKISNGNMFEGAEGVLGTRPIKVSFEHLSLGIEDFVEGEIIGSKYCENILNVFSVSLRESSYNPTTSKGVLKEISFVRVGESIEANIQTRNGMVLKIKDIEKLTTEKLLLAFDRYNYFHNEGIVDCTIEVFYSAGVGGVVAVPVW